MLGKQPLDESAPAGRRGRIVRRCCEQTGKRVLEVQPIRVLARHRRTSRAPHDTARAGRGPSRTRTGRRPPSADTQRLTRVPSTPRPARPAQGIPESNVGFDVVRAEPHGRRQMLDRRGAAPADAISTPETVMGFAGRLVDPFSGARRMVSSNHLMAPRMSPFRYSAVPILWRSDRPSAVVPGVMSTPA